MALRYLLALALLVGGCGASRDTITAEGGREAVMAADRAFAAAVAGRRLDAWLEVMAPDAVRFRTLGEPTVQGVEAIREMDAALFADSSLLLSWEPVDGGVFEGGRHVAGDSGWRCAGSVTVVGRRPQKIRPSAGEFAGRPQECWSRPS